MPFSNNPILISFCFPCVSNPSLALNAVPCVGLWKNALASEKLGKPGISIYSACWSGCANPNFLDAKFLPILKRLTILSGIEGTVATAEVPASFTSLAASET